MANYNVNFVPNRVSDTSSLGHAAGSSQERFAALQWCLANDWAALDIGKLERSDTVAFHGWLMWPYVKT
jgi:hypothetical protein